MNSDSPAPYVVDWPRPLPEVAAALARVYATGDWGRYEGRECRRLAARLTELHADQAVHLCTSGTVAVELALRGLGVRAGDEVVLAAYDFPGNFRAIEAIGATPVLVDLAEDNWSYDAERLAAATGPRTVAAIVSHLHGSLAPIRELRCMADSLRLRLLEDVCQAPGARLAGQTAGTFGDASVFSFGGSKLLTAGRGGAILSRDPQVLQRIRVFAERGNDAFPLSELQAAVLQCQLDRLQVDNQVRHERVTRLKAALDDLTCLKFSDSGPDCLPAYYKLGCRLVNADQSDDGGSLRNAVLSEMEKLQIPFGAGFRGFTTRSSRRCRIVGKLTHATRAANQTLVLHHPVLLADDWIIDSLATAIRQVVKCTFDASASGSRFV